jgi:putative transposase
VHGDNFGVYGARKVHAELRRQRHPVARCTVARLMRAAGLRGISQAKSPRTTVPSTADTRPDLVDRAFTATAPNQVWVADITYCRTSWFPAVLATPQVRGVPNAGEEVHRRAA